MYKPNFKYTVNTVWDMSYSLISVQRVQRVMSGGIVIYADRMA